MLMIGELVAAIHHIGSTAVEGLCAKPKIDIHAVLRNDALIPDAIERVKPHGYAFHGDPYDDGMWTFTQGHGSYGTRLYLCGPDNDTHIKRMRFRRLSARPPGSRSRVRRLEAQADVRGQWRLEALHWRKGGLCCRDRAACNGAC